MINKKQILFLIIFCSLFLFNTPILSDSLWNKKSSPYSANQANKIGDVVTILIEESSRSTLSADTKGKKTAEVDSDITASWRRIAALVEGTGEQRTIGGAKISGGNKFTGSGLTSRSSNIRAVISAVIVGVKPSGNFEIKGTRKVKINDELEVINIYGEIRPQDISSNNTVLSSQIANAKISIEGSGPVGNQQSPGILTRILNWLF